MDNYASLDSQLGKYDVNFKGDRPQDKKSLSAKRKSEELAVALKYNNSLEQAKDLNDSVTEPKFPEEDSLERAEKSFSSQPFESASSFAKNPTGNATKLIKVGSSHREKKS